MRMWVWTETRSQKEPESPQRSLLPATLRECVLWWCACDITALSPPPLPSHYSPCPWCPCPSLPAMHESAHASRCLPTPRTTDGSRQGRCTTMLNSSQNPPPHVLHPPPKPKHTVLYTIPDIIPNILDTKPTIPCHHPYTPHPHPARSACLRTIPNTVPLNRTVPTYHTITIQHHAFTHTRHTPPPRQERVPAHNT